MPVEYLKETPSQTAGPYVHIGTLPAHAGLPVRQNETLNVVEAPGEKIVVEGIVLDGSGAPVKDAMLELYQATAKGEVGDATIWARAAAVFETGEWRFDTIRPGALEWRGGRMQAPHLTLLIFARGINIHLHTRMYFPEDEAAQAWDKLNSGDLRLLFVSPERLAGEGLVSRLKRLGVTRLAIDEAHCVSLWGNYFRKLFVLV